jgi:hypothetical protein
VELISISRQSAMEAAATAVEGIKPTADSQTQLQLNSQGTGTISPVLPGPRHQVTRLIDAFEPIPCLQR